ncbi:E3 ubiquitin-protein ligase ATL4-like [Diospyros lotus]|uniref:E3 ubiquitin-protein ligase ATL4-like n=1 Tax=Diospyros lotus TaxID=55363 RepID=UPI002251894F|nr:E3 ubiquitin-protein ligase ATL4-like [Diospyros lotus]
MPRVLASSDAPPPLLTAVGGTSTFTTPTLPQLRQDGGKEPSSSASSSIVIVIIIVASAIIVSASIYFLLRYFSRHCHRSLRSVSVTEDVVPSRRDPCLYDRRASPSDDLINSLPLFTFGSVTGNITGGDCPVCLSKFEKNDRLRLLPLCCHAFHMQCIDAWLSSNQTCPLCRSTVHPTEADVMNKILSSTDHERGNSFRIEIGSVSRRREGSDSGDGRRSYSIGSFEYIVDDGYELSVGSTHRRGPSDCTSVDKESTGVPEPPGENLAAEVGGRSWLREYVDRFASISSRTVSFRSSGRFFTGSSRRSDSIVAVDDCETNRIGEEISELFRWFSGV